VDSHLPPSSGDQKAQRSSDGGGVGVGEVLGNEGQAGHGEIRIERGFGLSGDPGVDQWIEEASDSLWKGEAGAGQTAVIRDNVPS